MAAQFTDLRDFIATLEAEGQLVRISTEVDPNLEMTEIADRTLRRGGPALLFENPKGYNIPVLVNLFGTERAMRIWLDPVRLQALRLSTADVNAVTFVVDHLGGHANTQHLAERQHAGGEDAGSLKAAPEVV